ncbi:unnamed protein product [Effrenium voratum]|nr:unnamed protein product [Effrenium voratum]
MWLFSGWDQTACKPCAVANVTADTVRVDAALLQRQAEAAEATQTGAEVWATRFPPEFATQGAMQSKLQSQHEVQRVDSRVPPGVSMHESSGTEEEVPGSEVASPQGCSLAQKRLKGIKGDAGAAVGTALRWVGLSELALEYPYEDLAAATDHFSPEQRLGAGGVGAVYRGKLRGATEVAIKVLADMGGVEGFEDEVRVLSRFRHPHLVTLMGFGQREGQKYLVYELMPGGDVEGKLRQSRAWLEQHMKGAAVPQAPFPWQQRLQVALGAAKGLAHMVGSTPKTFHRDIKPANILLDADGTPKMADFGEGLRCLPAFLEGGRFAQGSGKKKKGAMPQPATTTCWLPSESSLKRESFNDLVRHRVTNAPMLLMKANVMGRTAMMAFPAVGDRSHLSTAPVKGSRRRSSSLSSIGMKSLRFSIKSQDGLGSIRQGTPVAEQRSGSSRFGFMPPDAGRIERKDSPLSPWLLSQVEAVYRTMDENADGRLTRSEAQRFFRRFGQISSLAMFSEVDEDGDGEILLSEWRRFWEQVKENGYSEADLAEELQLLKEGGWVDFLDDRNVSVNSRSGAKLAQ